MYVEPPAFSPFAWILHVEVFIRFFSLIIIIIIMVQKSVLLGTARILRKVLDM